MINRDFGSSALQRQAFLMKIVYTQPTPFELKIIYSVISHPAKK